MSTIGALFESLVERLPPGQLALDGPSPVTYRELLRLARSAAMSLERHPDVPIALVARRGPEALALLLGALGSGRVVSPLAPGAEGDSTLATLGSSLVVTDRPAPLPAGWLPLGELIMTPDSGDPTTGAVRLDRPGTLVWFSSGSTGRPKGIVSSSAALAVGWSGYGEALALSPADRVAWLAPLHFGASLTVAFGTLLSGAALVPLAPDEGSSALRDALASERVTLLHTVPSLFRRLAAAPLPATIRCVKLGGEAAFISDLELFQRSAAPDAVLVNGLGITEAAGNVTWARFDRGARLPGPLLPVGVPAPGADVALTPEGRIAIRSAALAEGYWGDADGTAAAFRTPSGWDGRWFVTNDLGRWVDGALEVVGRSDDVIKIRGQAVALTTIEALITAGCAGVSQAAVVSVPRPEHPGEALLVAFVVGKPPTLAELRTVLPELMWPSRVTGCTALPTGGGGKVDRRALATLALEPPKPRRAGETRDRLVGQLVSLWEATLGIEDLGPDDDFFALGGSSLEAVGLVGRIARVLEVELPLAALLAHPTPAMLARALRDQGWQGARAAIVTLRPGQDELAPVFVMGGRGSEVLALQRLAHRLTPRTVYGIQADAQRGAPLHLRSWRGTAQALLPEVLRLQPRGPYHLVGTSAGGRGMLELARLLRKRGEEVALLALVDTYGDGYLRLRPGRDCRANLAALKQRINPHGPDEDGISLGAFAQALRLRISRELALVKIALGRRRHPPSTEHRHGYAMALADHANRITRHAPVDVRIDLFRCAVQPPPELAARWPDLGWTGRGLRGLVVHELPGNHADMLHEPAVALLAGELIRLMETG